jgi:hypothetical protein
MTLDALVRCQRTQFSSSQTEIRGGVVYSEQYSSCFISTHAVLVSIQDEPFDGSLAVGILISQRIPPTLPLEVAREIAQIVQQSSLRSGIEMFAQLSRNVSGLASFTKPLEQLGFNLSLVTEEYAALAPGVTLPRTYVCSQSYRWL